VQIDNLRKEMLPLASSNVLTKLLVTLRPVPTTLEYSWPRDASRIVWMLAVSFKKLGFDPCSTFLNKVLKILSESSNGSKF
jgi:hypothetical protein